SVNVVRIKVASHLAALNQPAISLEILKRQHALGGIAETPANAGHGQELSCSTPVTGVFHHRHRRAVLA
ncbi:hypothetical protein, partial [Paracoccus haematequi]|uniref:hypothetical protein n=1 Tax=Paracoccus haematequi TaxID=2491866 RepID=UPI0019D227FC